MEDSGFGTRTQIVQGIPRDDHSANHIQVIGDKLYVGIGTRTRNGAFQTQSDVDDYGESAYGGTIAVIDDLNAVASTTNSAGFYPANPTLTQFRDLINGTNPVAGMPFTTTANNKLKIHSAGTRNPFGLAVDGDGEVWFSVNFQQTENHVYDRDNLTSTEGDATGGDGLQDDIHDQFFHASEKADYGYRNGNWQDGNVPGNTDATGAGFFQKVNRQASFTFDNYVDPVASNEADGSNPALNQDYNVNNPTGLGPSSSSNGFDFNQSNELPLKFQKDAFLARWVGTKSDGNDSITYRDVVSVDSSTGKVSRLATGFNNPLDVISDGKGNFLVADWGDSIYKISPTDPVTSTHNFSWDSDADGNYSDRLTWNANSLAEADRLVPHAWGTSRYDVTIDRPGANPVVTLDQSATIEDLTLGDTLKLSAGNVLSVQNELLVLAGGTLMGEGEVDGEVTSSGTVSPGGSIGELSVQSYNQESGGTLHIELSDSGNDHLVVSQNAILEGALDVSLLDGFIPELNDTFEILSTGGTLFGTFDTMAAELPDLDAGLAWLLNYQSDSLSLDVVESFTADFDHDGDVDSEDLATWESAYGVNGLADSDGDGDSDGNDFLNWQKQFGSVISAASANTTIPEPTSAWLGLIALAAGFTYRRSC